MDEVIIYCDGACQPNPNGDGGWAAIILYKGHRKEVFGATPNTTNNRMELIAALEGLKLLKRPCTVTLHSDSQYLCKAFNSGWLKNWARNGWQTKEKKPVLNKDLWIALLEQAAIHKITWVWVKGHSTNVENNRCDELAVKARLELKKT